MWDLRNAHSPAKVPILFFRTRWLAANSRRDDLYFPARRCWAIRGASWGCRGARTTTRCCSPAARTIAPSAGTQARQASPLPLSPQLPQARTSISSISVVGNAPGFAALFFRVSLPRQCSEPRFRLLGRAPSCASCRPAATGTSTCAGLPRCEGTRLFDWSFVRWVASFIVLIVMRLCHTCHLVSWMRGFAGSGRCCSLSRACLWAGTQLPAILSTSSFDGTVSVYSLADTGDGVQVRAVRQQLHRLAPR